MVMQRPTVKVELFEGPLDLLLFLIAKNKLDILDIPIADILVQYNDYLQVLREDNIEIASEFVEMAARLVYIKTAMLLPKTEESEQLRQELTAELMEYQVCRTAAEKLREVAAFNRFVREPTEPEIDRTYTRRHSVMTLGLALISAIGHEKRRQPPTGSDFSAFATKPPVPVAWGVITVIKQIKSTVGATVDSCFEKCTKRDQLVAVFMALLELIKAGRVQMDDRMRLKINREKKHGR